MKRKIWLARDDGDLGLYIIWIRNKKPLWDGYFSWFRGRWGVPILSTLFESAFPNMKLKRGHHPIEIEVKMRIINGHD